MQQQDIQKWLRYWDDAQCVNVNAIRAFEHVYQARKFCSVMRGSIFANVSDLQIWNALQAMRAERAAHDAA